MSAAKRALLEVNVTVIEAIIERARSAALSAEDCEQISNLLHTATTLKQAIAARNASIKKLRQIAFGVTTEKSSQVLAEGEPADAAAETTSNATATNATATNATATNEPHEKSKGHGRNGADAYPGATRVRVPSTLKSGDRCHFCPKGRVYPQEHPAIRIRVVGRAPLDATVFEHEQMRCNLCGETYKTEPLSAAAKYDESAVAQIGNLKYGTGMPFNRLAKLQHGMGVPLPAATQWDLVEKGARDLLPIYREIQIQAAQGDVVHNDDTPMKVLELTPEARAEDAADKGIEDKRTGAFTTAIVSVADGHQITVYCTGTQHAGENLEDVLAHRSPTLPPPIQMCDALSRNTDGDFVTIVANCLGHGRRKFVDVVESFPEQCRFVLEAVREIYRNDATARRDAMTPDARLRFHQEMSGPLMSALEKWLHEQFERKKVEPNSALGEAIGYLLNHWSKLTLFLRVPGAPLDNNICERALKKAILHRKNAYFYKTLNGALVGDIWMSLIHTADRNAFSPFQYLVALLRHKKQIRDSPADWMPWNYEATLGRQRPSASSSLAIAA